MALYFVFLLLLRVTAAFRARHVLSDDYVYSAGTESSRANTNLIFSALHSAGRQWGSSVQHNGMSFFPATIMEGTVLYHGGWVQDPVIGMEWMALEVQHAEMFAQGHRMAHGMKQDLGSVADASFVHPKDVPWEWRLLQDGPGKGGDWEPGYIQVYKASRPLKLLYIDGMSAATCDIGPEDAQDKILLNDSIKWHQEFKRAKKLCELADELGLDGILRMETGFEIIKCNFSTGLDLLAINKKPKPQEAEAEGQWTLFENVREASQRYHGNHGGRISLDYSSMVSAYFYPTNLSNPDTKSILPRLSFADPEQLFLIRSDVIAVMQNPQSDIHVDWQGVVDMIAARYSDRLQYMATSPPHQDFLSIINNLLNIYIDYKQPSGIESLIETCSMHYLQSVKSSTKQDHLIMAALRVVTCRICKTLFEVRETLLQIENDDSGTEKLASAASPSDLILNLNKWLDWTDWRFCGSCGLDEVCFIATFPWGTEEDHFHPRCKTPEEVNARDNWGYWAGDWPD
jgi:hypothetical protein